VILGSISEVSNVWREIEKPFCQKLVDSYRKRLQEVIDNKGYNT